MAGIRVLCSVLLAVMLVLATTAWPSLASTALGFVQRAQYFKVARVYHASFGAAEVRES